MIGLEAFCLWTITQEPDFTRHMVFPESWNNISTFISFISTFKTPQNLIFAPFMRLFGPS